MSKEADVLVSAAITIANSAEASQVLFGGRDRAISQLRLLAVECGVGDWDGNGALAVDPLAASRAEDFIRALPDGFRVPEVAAEPDGSVSLDWLRSRHRALSISVGSGQRVAYAWLEGGNRGHGVATFDGRAVPASIIPLINSVMAG